jgi:streptogramin lyase
VVQTTNGPSSQPERSGHPPADDRGGLTAQPEPWHKGSRRDNSADGITEYLLSKSVLTAVADREPQMSKIRVVQIAQDHDLGSLHLDDKGRVWYRDIKTYGERLEVPETVVQWKQLDLPEEPTTQSS